MIKKKLQLLKVVLICVFLKIKLLTFVVPLQVFIAAMDVRQIMASQYNFNARERRVSTIFFLRRTVSYKAQNICL